MARSAYLYLLALGRQCYEPQNQNQSQGQATAPPAHTAGSDSSPDADSTTAVATSPLPAPAAVLGSVSAVSSDQASINLQRSLRKAQNDVLNTIGLQLHKGGTWREKSRAERSALQEREDDMGLLLGGIDLACMYFFTWPLIGLRNELQTFQGLEDIPYMELLRLVVKNRTVLDCFAGVSAHIIYQLINVLREYLQSLLFKQLKKHRIFQDPRTRKPNRRLLNFLYKGMTLSAFFLVYPIYRHSVLQSLHLIPATPILPPLSDFAPFRTLASLPWLSIAATVLNPVTYLNSAYIWSLFQQKAVFRLQILFLNMLNRNLPRTDKFEKAELSSGFVVGEAEYDEFLNLTDDDEGEVGEIGVGEGDEELISVITGNAAGQQDDTIDIGQRRDIIDIDGYPVPVVNGLAGGGADWPGQPFNADDVVGIPNADSPTLEHHVSRRGSNDTNDGVETQTFTAMITPDTPVLGHQPDNGGLPNDDSGFLDPNDLGSTMMSNNDDARSGISEIEVQVTTSMRGSPEMSGALEHQQRHRHRRQHSHGHGHGNNGTARGGRGRGRNDRDRRYRNTHLSTHPVEVLSSHMSDAAAMALTVGVESMVMRANAMTLFAATPATELVLPNSNLLVLAANAGMLGLSGAGLLGTRVMMPGGGVRRVGGSSMIIGVWETGRNWVGISKGFVMEWGLAWGLFEVAYLVSRWVGVQWYGYGRVKRR